MAATAAGAQVLGSTNLPEADLQAEALQNALKGLDENGGGDVVPVGQDWANLHRYRVANAELMKQPSNPLRTVMMGDSITDNWPGLSGNFFTANSLVGRGIGGQTTAQMVLRFAPDVIRLKPRVVHILAGTNDIAENQDPYDPMMTTNNLQTMISLAKANGIRVVMGSVPPATSFAWKPKASNPHDKIIALNKWIMAICQAQGLIYVDYWSALVGSDGGLRPELGLDSVHPNAAGYAVMGPMALSAIDKYLGARKELISK